MKTAIKTIELTDYDEIKVALEQMRWLDNEFKTQVPTCRIDTPTTNPDSHKHKFWEWARTTHAIREVFGPRIGLRILDIGSAFSLLGPALAYLGHHVIEAEPDGGMVQERGKLQDLIHRVGDGKLQTFQCGYGSLVGQVGVSEQFDVVCSISTIEHVETQAEGPAWAEMVDLVKKNGLLHVTLDCMPEARKGFKNDQVRATNFDMEMVRERVEALKTMGMVPIGPEDYTFHGPFVYDYTFASILMKKGYAGR